SVVEDEGIIYTGEPIELYHADEGKTEGKTEGKSSTDKEDTETVQDVIDTMNDKQKVVLYALLEDALSGDGNAKDDENKEEDSTMKHNVFDKETEQGNVLTHSEQEKILNMAKSSNCGTLRTAFDVLANSDDTLKHSFEPNAIEALFPEYKDLKTGAPELITNDVNGTWIGKVIGKVHKSPISRIRTRQADARNSSLETELRAFGYKKGTLKQNMGNIKLVSRTTDPQTVYVKDFMNRDDKLDIIDFDVVAYIHSIMRGTLNEELATAILLGDDRLDGDPQKIAPDKIRPIWGDDPLYVIYSDVDKAGMEKQLKGTATGANFGDNFIYAEAIIEAALYAREQYRGSGALDYYCDPHMVNVMLLARDRNGHRMYKDVADLKSALNVNEIVTVEKFANKTRTVGGKTKKLLGVFVNLNDYQVGATKGGEISTFNDFDIDFNQEKYLIETRLSGALTRVKSAIILEEDVTPAV
ncbi:MAG: caudovirus prohead protease, partial [Clostridia bacterium]